ncbi:unnamed protein product [Diabrotica balteata]|uniref:Cell growth-regulating nucleolar protein n=1 Tax=Diabrotica balteata TaxID=107213 RepID=A0A9N9T1G4_DIABA|nr:unnamed protein product [Diabrotica balteata]
MVVFTCNHCGESLRKPTVEKHYNFCRSAKNLTCVDCFKDFRGEEYVTHTKCITEEERYSRKGSIPNGIVKKGELKQESWVDMIKSILEQSNLKPSNRSLLNTICNYSNIPRKKPKFMNFIKSSSGGRVNMREVEEVWNIIESYKAKKATKQNNTQTSEDIKPENEVTKRKVCEDIANENSEHEVPKKKKKKEKLSNNAENGDFNTNREDGEPKKKKKKETSLAHVENGDSNENTEHEGTKKKKKKEAAITHVENGDSNENTEHEGEKKKNKKNKLSIQVENDNTAQENLHVEEETGNENFNYTNKILNILAKKRTITLQKLQKKVINAYLKHSGESEVSPKIIKKFNKKLKKIENIEITDDEVSLKENS